MLPVAQCALGGVGLRLGHGVHRDWLAWTGLISRVGWPADTGVGSRSLGRTWPSLSPAPSDPGDRGGGESDRKCNKKYGHFACSRVQGFTQARGMASPVLFYDAWLYVLLLPPTQ